MCIQSGELVIISKVKIQFKIKDKVLKSLRFYVIMMIICAGVLSGFAVYMGTTRTYETRAVSLRTADIQNQCTILCDQLNNYNYLQDSSSEVINAYLTQLTNIYIGRVMIINQDLKVVTDTYGLDEGKMMVSDNVVRCLKGQSSNHYDKANRFIEVTSPITVSGSDEIMGVILASVSTDTIEDSLYVMRVRGRIFWGIACILVAAMAFFVADWIVRPIRRMKEEMEGIKAGYADEMQHVGRFAETEEIADSFNSLIGRFKQIDASREEFVSNVSHELKTPLASMKVLADSLII